MRNVVRTSLALAIGTVLALPSAAIAGKDALHSQLLGKASQTGEIAKSLAATGTANVIVYLKTTSGASRDAVSSALEQPATRAAMKAEIAASIDAVVATHLPSIVASGRHFAKFSSTPGFAATLTEKELQQLAADPRVTHIGYDLPVKGQLDQSRSFIGAPVAHRDGALGNGRSVAVLDQGVQRAHQFIGLSRVAAEGCFLHVNQCPNGTTEQTGPGAAEAANATVDHGTHVAGIALGSQPAANPGPTRGIAPRARLVHITVLDNSNSGTWSNVQRGIEHLEDLVIAQPTLRVAAFNMSLGGGAFGTHCDDDPTFAPTKTVMDRLRRRGVLGAIAAGNDSSTNGMSAPGCISSILAIASTSKTGVPSSFTNISPMTDMWAPGGEFGACIDSSIPTSTFAGFCGTSMATPHVAGAIAALKSKVPTATACEIESALKLSGPLLADNRTGGLYKRPRLRLDRALDRLLNPAAPANDSFATAAVIPASLGTSIYTTFGSNIGATMEPSEPPHSVPTAGASVWWRWKPSSSGPVTIDTRGSNTDTVLAVYRGSLSNLVLVRQNNNEAAGVLTSKVTFNAVANVTYRIAVAGRTASNVCSLQLNIGPAAPANDNFANATNIVVGTGITQRNGSNVFATREPSEPIHRSSSDTTTVWWRFEAPISGTMVIDTDGSAFDTILAVYTGTSLSGLSLVGLDDDGGTGVNSRVEFSATAGTTYRVMVTGYSGASGSYALRIDPAGP